MNSNLGAIGSVGSVMQEMQSMAAQAAGGAVTGGALGSSVSGASGGNFASMLKSSLDQVDSSQKSSLAEAHAFELGAPNVGLNDVMVDMQKASINFQMAAQVRNKLVSAYSEISQMSV
jgi:flagellar hook-basal body complex protein FliE